MDIAAIIEDPQGSTVRHFWDAEGERWISKQHSHSSTPWPCNYGYLPGTRNPADGDELDTLVISGQPIATGTRVRVRVLGILFRPDGDDKILAALARDPETIDILTLNDVPGAIISAIETWFAEWSEVGEWGGEASAIQRIRTCGGGEVRL